MIHEPLLLMPLDLDTFVGSERFLTGEHLDSDLGRAFKDGMRAYLHARYGEAVAHFKTALEVGGSEPAPLLGPRERAVICLYIGNACSFDDQWDTARCEYEAAINIDPTLPEAHYNLGVACAANARWEQAVTAFHACLEQNPSLYDAHFALGRSYQHIKDPVRAYIHYNSARELRPQAGEPLYYMGLMHQGQGATELAQQSFAEALRVEPDFISPETEPSERGPKSDEDTINWYYRLSDDLKAQNYDGEAERIYRALLQWRPNEYRACYLLGNLLARTQRWEEAIREYLRIPKTDPYFVGARLRIGTVLRLCRRLRQAYQVLYECARLRPNEGQIFVQLGKILYDLEKPGPAAAALERATRLLPNDSLSWYLLGFMYLVQGRDTWAIQAWRRAIQITPHAWSLRYDLACLYIQRLRYDAATSELQEVLNHFPNDQRARVMLGICFKEMTEPARAIAVFEEVIKKEPDNLQAIYYLGACYLQMGNGTLGRAYLRKYDRLAPVGKRSGAGQNDHNRELPALRA
ncbi:MAG: tetratricopeptide repeat protein [Herpetosiphon sp.]